MSFPFDEKKATQAAGLLLRLAGGRENYTKLLKVLYLADREALEKTGTPIAGARFVNMENGPLASDVYDCVKGTVRCETWSAFIVREGKYDIALIREPGDGELSDFEIETLTQLHGRYRSHDFRAMIDVVHELPEWIDPGKTSVPLEPETILEAVGVDAETIAALASRDAHVAAVDRFLS